ncbi:HNH endonuclease [Leifsonia sp. NCR5]|uniref:HNH endonuclease n=1 Tax=Leifsonia sp. NCR5 TaxID=1978342 RepID=UPI000A197F77|nr:HNH endonuclease [Leifsonia sp. NCR5]
MTHPTKPWSLAAARRRVPADLIAFHEGKCGTGRQYQAGCPACAFINRSYLRWSRDPARQRDLAAPIVDFPGEQWRAIDGTTYHVSTRGRVKNCKANRPARLIRPCPRGNGGHVAVAVYGPNKWSYIHRLVAQAFIPNPHDYPLVRHLDGNPTNNSVDNLAWGTSAMNTADAQAHGTMPTAQHGTTSKYGAGCRCDRCTSATKEYARTRAHGQ